MYYPAVRLQLHVEYFEQVALCGGAELLEQPVPFGERMVVTDECVEVFPVVCEMNELSHLRRRQRRR